MGRKLFSDFRQVFFRNFPEKIKGIAEGTTTAFLQSIEQPPDGYDYKGKAFNGAELFTNGAESYFFPKNLYEEGNTLYIREQWAIRFDEMGAPGFVYKAGWSEDGPIEWRSSTYMPIEAARFFLKVDSAKICRIRDIKREDAKSLGVTSKSWRRDIESMWDGELTKQEIKTIASQLNPWVQVLQFHLIDKPENWPSGFDSKMLKLGSTYKRYTIRLAETGEVLATGTAAQCGEAMGFRSAGRIYTFIHDIKKGINRKYTIEISQEPIAQKHD